MTSCTDTPPIACCLRRRPVESPRSKPIWALQKFAGLVSGFEIRGTPQIGLGESAALVLLGSQRFQLAPRQIATSANPIGEIVWDLHGCKIERLFYNGS